MAAQLAVDADATHEALDALLFERLVRTARVSAHSRVLECYHDKIRESVADALTPDALRRIHARLAEALSVQADSEPGAPGAALSWRRGQPACQRLLREGRRCLCGRVGVRVRFPPVSAVPGPHRSRPCAVPAGASQARRDAGIDGQQPRGRRGVSRCEHRCAARGSARTQARSAHLLSTSGFTDEARVLLGEVLAAIGLSMPRSPRTRWPRRWHHASCCCAEG